jgi:hypothetical protein
MRLQGPQLPDAPTGDNFNSNLVAKLKALLTKMTDQVNGVSEGHVQAVTNATTAPPTSTLVRAQIGDFVRNSNPTVQGAAGSHFIVIGWTCVVAGSPGTWVQNRTLTGT